MLKELYTKENIIRFVWTWVGHVWRTDWFPIKLIRNQIYWQRSRIRLRQRSIGMIRKYKEVSQPVKNEKIKKNIACVREIWDALILEAKNGLRFVKVKKYNNPTRKSMWDVRKLYYRFVNYFFYVNWLSFFFFFVYTKTIIIIFLFVDSFSLSMPLPSTSWIIHGSCRRNRR